MRRGRLSLVRDLAPRPVVGGSVSAERRAEWLTEELTRKLVILDAARGELFSALAFRRPDDQVAAARRVRAAAELMYETADRYTRSVL